jgi:hypothetical protein
VLARCALRRITLLSRSTCIRAGRVKHRALLTLSRSDYVFGTLRRGRTRRGAILPTSQAALLNLVSNARDAMPNDGTVTIVTRNVIMRPEMLDERDLMPGRYIMIAVRDTGGGMDGEVLQHAFEPLFTTKKIGRATGLGLSQLRAFARNSGGTARIESAPDQGTTVRIYLPQTRSAARLSRPGEKH